MLKPLSPRRQAGISLIEVLVSVALIGFGLLGLAKLQGMATANTKTASSRSMAAYLSSSLAGSMRANPAYWRALPGGTSIALITSGAVNPQSSATCLVAGPVSATAACTPQQLAAYDMDQWSDSARPLLPNVTASINCPPVAVTTPPTPLRCDIAMQWEEKEQAASGAAEGAVAAAGTLTAQYSLAVWP